MKTKTKSIIIDGIFFTFILNLIILAIIVVYLTYVEISNKNKCIENGYFYVSSQCIDDIKIIDIKDL